jgi:BlaR1 peptidase M56
MPSGANSESTAPVMVRGAMSVADRAIIPTQAFLLRSGPVAFERDGRDVERLGSFIVWGIGLLGIALARCRSWFRVRAALGTCTPVELPIPVPASLAQGAGEPGVVGFLRPVLVFPARLLEQLDARQLDAILAHELCHVRRRDNLFAAVHMLVEAIFWFQPLVWWSGARMMEERELACDEEVLRTGCMAADYAEGILKVCRFVVDPPLQCVSGVTGADVGKRLRTILAGTIGRELSAGRKAALAGIGVAAFAMPIFIGALNARAVQAQSPARADAPKPQMTAPPATPPSRPVAPPAAAPLQFEVASVKAAPEGRPFLLPRVLDPQSFRSVGTVTGPVSLMEWLTG